MRKRVLTDAEKGAVGAAMSARVQGAASAAEHGAEADDVALVRFGGRSLDLAARIYADAEGRERILTRGESAVLAVFLHNPGKVLSRRQLRSAGTLAKSDGPGARGIDMLIARLRRKIEADPLRPELILTVAGMGYRLALRPQQIMWMASGGDDAPMREPAIDARPPAERRQVTVVAGQLVGFAALASRLDPEDLQQIAEAVHRTCAEVVAHFDGQFVRLLGDSVLIYFGYPRAHEDDAERAILAGFELVQAMTVVRGQFDIALDLRIGIATGLLVMAPGANRREELHSAVGEPLNVALRLQAVAAPGSIVVSEQARKLAGRSFVYAGAQAVRFDRGMPPMRAWRLAGLKPSSAHFDVLHAPGMSRFVGRGEELTLLRRQWSQACAGTGQLTLVSGEPGIGKSRLALAFENEAKPGIVLRFGATARRSDAPFFVLIDELQRAAHFDAADTPAGKRRKLAALLKRCGPQCEAELPLLAGLLSLTENRAGAGQVTPQQFKSRILAALLERIETLASAQPVLLRLEDAQWSDPTSLEFFEMLAERTSRLRLMVLITARPEFAFQAVKGAPARTIALAHLGPHEAESMIADLTAAARLSHAVKGRILEHADGIPLFLEEITRSVIERGERVRWTRRRSSEPDRLEVPSTLRASLLARLDRLGRAKDIAQTAAVIGREFSWQLLRAVAAMPDKTLAGLLDRLTASGLVFRRGYPPYASYLFKHALVRDTAYDMLVRARREKLHAAIAAALEQGFPEACQLQPELLAHHHMEAGQAAAAVTYLTVASERALQHSGVTESMLHVSKAQALLDTLPNSKERAQLELRLQVVLGRTFTARRSFTAPQTRETYRRARERCEALGNQTLLPMTLLGQWVGTWSASEHTEGLRQAQQLRLCGERNADAAASALGHMALGMTFAVLGQPPRARQHFERALRIDHFALPHRPPFLFSDLDGRISSLTYLHDCLFLLGLSDQARVAAAKAEDAAQEAERLSPTQSYSQALARNHLLRMYSFRRDMKKTYAAATALLQLSQQQGFPYFTGTGLFYRGWALAHMGEPKRAIALCRNGMTQLRTIGSSCWLPRYFALLAECYEQAGHIEHGMQAAASALESAERTGEQVWLAEIHHLHGRFALRRGKVQAAEAAFARALKIARRQQARRLELRAATSLARLLRQGGRSDRARRILLPLCKDFEGGVEDEDLQQARAALAR